jgi:hypothetical protein
MLTQGELGYVADCIIIDFIFSALQQILLISSKREVCGEEGTSTLKRG